HLAPQCFNSMQMMDKMKEFITKFVDSPEVKSDVPSTENLKTWLKSFKFESVPGKAIDELMDVLGCAEDKNKIAIMDLIRLLLLQEPAATHILSSHWQNLEINIFGYIQCM